MNDKFSLYQTDGLWGIIENTSNEKQTSIKSYFGSDLIIKRLNEQDQQIDRLKQQLAEKDKEIERLKQQLAEKQNTIDEINKEFVQAVNDWKTLCAEKDKEIKKLNWQLKDKDFIIKNLNHSLSVAPNANAGQRARIDELTKIVKEKDKEIERLKVFEKAYYFNQLQASQEDIQQFQQLANQSAVNINHIAITELEKVKTLIQNAINFEKPNFVEVYDAINNQINDLRGEKDE